MKFRADVKRLLSVCPVLTVFAVLNCVAVSNLGGQTLDRTRPPVLTEPTPLHLPGVVKLALTSGPTLYVVPMHEVPLVQVTVRVRSGGRYDGQRSGLAAFAASMLSEGAGDRDAAGIASQISFLGANLGTATYWDNVTISLNTPVRTLEPALDLLADLVLRPRFRSADIVRQRNLRLADIAAGRSEPGEMADLAFNATLYPAAHPYHRALAGDSASVASFDSAMVRRFHSHTFGPAGAEIIVTGDIEPATALRLLNSRLSRWRRATRPPPVPATGPAPRARATTVTLVDKPGAAQSSIIIGAAGVPRSSPDFAALEVMNTILGGSYSSRINQNLRETHGYTYGAQSDFTYRPLPGPFEAESAVRTDVTDSSLAQFFSEFTAIRESPVSDTELHRAINYLILGLPGQFETTGQMAGMIGSMLTFHLPLDYFNGYARQIGAVTAADVQRVARHYIDPAHLVVIVVGDVAAIQPGIEALHLGPIVIRNPRTAPAGP